VCVCVRVCVCACVCARTHAYLGVPPVLPALILRKAKQQPWDLQCSQWR